MVDTMWFYSNFKYNLSPLTFIKTVRSRSFKAGLERISSSIIICIGRESDDPDT